MKYLIIDDEEELLDLHNLTLSLLDPAGEILSAHSGAQALEIVGKTSDIDLVICDYRMPHMNGAQVQAYLLEHHPNLPFILCSGNNFEECTGIVSEKIFGFVQKPNVMNGMKPLIQKLNDSKKKPESNSTAPIVNAPAATPAAPAASANVQDLYLPFSTRCLFVLGEMPCDIYVGLSTSKYLKILSKGDILSQDDNSKFESKSNHLWVLKDDAEMAIHKLENLMTSMIHTQENKIAGEEDLFSLYFKEAASLFPASEKVQQLSKEWINKATALLRGANDLENRLVRLLEAAKGDYVLHVNLLTLIGIELLKKAKWEGEAAYLKLSTAALFHDISVNFSHFPPDSELSSLEALDLKHSVKGAELLKTFRYLPPDVDRIVLEHHEKPDGSGYPRGLNAQALSPLSSIFILAHSIADLYQNQTDLRGRPLMDVLMMLDASYRDRGQFKKIFQLITA